MVRLRDCWSAVIAYPRRSVSDAPHAQFTALLATEASEDHGGELAREGA